MKTIIEYAKISSLDINTASEIMTAAINSMGVSAKRAADVWSYLGDATATGSDEIGRAMQKVGGTAGALNVNFEKVSSWIAVVSSKTRESAETIGQSIKSIMARIQSMKENGFDEEDGTKVNQVAKALSAVGVQLMDGQGQFRNFGTVMDELGKKWKDLDSRQKAYISTTVAGTYQQSR
jgi:TP901 family phage tail tape measure protein